MAANATAFRTYLETGLGFSAVISSQIATTQGFDNFDSFDFATADVITNLVISINKTPVVSTSPEGTKHFVNAHQSQVLQQLVFYARYIKEVNRTHSLRFGTQANLGIISRYYNKSYHDLKRSAHPVQFDGKDAIAMIESMDAWLSSTYGSGTLLLSYVVRPDINPMVADPGFLRPSVPDEILRRAIHTGQNFHPNNGAVWSMIHAVTHTTSAYSIVKKFGKDRNGRLAYLALVQHYKGDAHLTVLKTTAENTLRKIFWNGSTRNFTFEMFTAKLNGAYTDLESTGDFRSEEHRVDALLNKCSGDKNLSGYLAVVRSNPTLLKSWNKTVQTLGNGVNSHQNQPSNQRNISAFETGGRGRGRGRHNGRGRFGRGRHGGRGRGGRHNNRGRGSSGSHHPDVMSQDGRTILNGGTYSPSLWNSFSREDQNIVHQQRNSRDQETARTVAALLRQPPNSEALPPADQPPQGDVGSTMIRRRHGAS